MVVEEVGEAEEEEAEAENDFMNAHADAEDGKPAADVVHNGLAEPEAARALATTRARIFWIVNREG